MTKNWYLKGLFAASLVVAGGAAFAQEGVTVYNGQQLYAVGAGPHFTTFAPSANDPAGRMLNNGVAPDASGSDNVWTVTRTATPGTGFSEWKMGSWAGVTVGVGEWSEESSGNQWYDQSVGTITFYYRDNNAALPGDGFSPYRDHAYTDINYTSYVAGADGVYLTGSFSADFGGTNWTPTDTTQELVDDGTNGDVTSGDGIYSRAYNFTTSGLKEMILFIDPAGATVPDWNLAGSQIKDNGPNSAGANNISVNILPSHLSGATLIELRASDLRYRITPPAAPPPAAGYFAFGPWGSDYTSDSQMTAVATGYEGTFTVATAGYYRVEVNHSDGAGNIERYPLGTTGGYPILTTTNGQQVRINLYTTPLADTDFNPTHNFIYSDPDSRLDFAAASSTVQFIGFLSLYGTVLSGTGGDWDKPQAGASGSESSAGSEVFKVTIGGVLAGVPGGSTPKQMKGVWTQPDVTPAIDLNNGSGSDWDGQFGGVAGNRRCGVVHGNTDIEAPSVTFADGENWDFVVDMATGRAGRVLDGSATVPLRPANINTPVGSAAVEGWQMFE